MNDNNRYPYDPRGRFITPDPTKQVITPYDQDSRLFQDLAQRGVRPVRVYRINLGTAGSLSIKESGFHFVQYGWMQQTPPNDGNKPVNTTTLVNVQINTQGQDRQYDEFPAKHARGFSGPFDGLYLTWTAQQSTGVDIYCDFIIYKSYERPWIDGESAT